MGPVGRVDAPRLRIDGGGGGFFLSLTPPEVAPHPPSFGGVCEESEDPGEALLSESEELLLVQSFTASADPAFLRGSCVAALPDFTLPALTPRERAGEIPASLDLDLFGDTDLVAALRSWHWNDDGSVSWIGVLTGPSVNAKGEVIITVVDGTYALTARLGTWMWDLRVDPECGYRLTEWDEAIPSGVTECEVEDDENTNQSAAYVQGADVQHGVLPLHPELVLPTIDVLVVASQEAVDDFSLGAGGLAGLTAYAHNRVHELDLSFLRTSHRRTHRPRLVGFYVLSTILDTDESRMILQRMKASAAVDIARDTLGADIIAGLANFGDAYGRMGGLSPLVNWRPGLEDNPSGSPNWQDDGYFVVNTGEEATLRWSFSHEFGHTFGAMHPDASFQAAGDRNGTSAFIGEVRYRGQGQSYLYKDMMAHADPPERIPVFGWRPNRAWVPRVTDDDTLDYDLTTPQIDRNPKLDRLDLDLFVDERFDARTPVTAWANQVQPPLDYLQGIRLGGQESLPAGTFLRCAGDLLFDFADTDPWSEPDTPDVATAGARCQIETDEHSLAENVAFYKQATTVPFEGELAQVLSAEVVNDHLTLTFDETAYFTTFFPPQLCSSPSSTGCQCADPTEVTCSLDANPYFVELGTTLGADDVVSTWALPAVCTGGACTLTLPENQPGIDEYTDGLMHPFAVIDDTQEYYGRLWSQVRANDWGYVEFRVRPAATTVVGCDVEDPRMARPGWATDTCAPGVVSIAASSPAFPGQPAVLVDLDPTGLGTAPAWLLLSNHAPAPPPWRAFDLTLNGATEAGQRFCCHVYVGTQTTRGVDIQSGDEASIIAAGTVGPFLMGPANLAHIAVNGQGGDDLALLQVADAGKVRVLGGPGADTVHLYGAWYGDVDGGGGTDELASHQGGVWAPPPAGMPAGSVLLLGGGPAADFLGQGGDWEPDHPAPPVEVYGGAGANTLCAVHGGVKLVGSTSAGGPNVLYVGDSYATATSYLMNPATTAAGAGSTCGAPVHAFTHGAWAGPACTYPTSGPPPAACEGIQ